MLSPVLCTATFGTNDDRGSLYESHSWGGGWVVERIALWACYFVAVWRVLSLRSTPLYPVTTLWKVKIFCMNWEPNHDLSTGSIMGDSLFKMMINWCHLHKTKVIFEIVFTIWRKDTYIHAYTQTSLKFVSRVNHLKPTGHVMHQQFNIQQLYVLPHTVFMCFVFIWEQTATCAT